MSTILNTGSVLYTNVENSLFLREEQKTSSRNPQKRTRSPQPTFTKNKTAALGVLDQFNIRIVHFLTSIPQKISFFTSTNKDNFIRGSQLLFGALVIGKLAVDLSSLTLSAGGLAIKSLCNVVALLLTVGKISVYAGAILLVISLLYTPHPNA